jgi:hypothetical protein
MGIGSVSHRRLRNLSRALVSLITAATSEASRLYKTLQSAVDRDMQSTGFVPGAEYGTGEGSPTSQKTSHRAPANGSSCKRSWKASDRRVAPRPERLRMGRPHALALRRTEPGGNAAAHFPRSRRAVVQTPPANQHQPWASPPPHAPRCCLRRAGTHLVAVCL